MSAVDELVKMAAFVLAGRSQPLKSSEIIKIILTPEGQAAMSTMGISLPPDEDLYSLAARLSKALRRHVESTPASSRIVDGTSDRGWKKGPNATRSLGQSHVNFTKTESTLYLGVAGEYAVMSELIAADWNATKLAADDGADLIATKGRELRTVQVKTAHARNGSEDRFYFLVDQLSHERYHSVQHYYVFVLRRHTGTRWLNDFLILSSPEFQQYVHMGYIKGGAGKLGVNIQIINSRYFLDENVDLTEKVNQFRKCFH